MTSSASEADEVARSPSPTIFVSDPSAEAERIAQALRATGYVVVDVPMSMLFARVAVQRPRVILIDADTEGTLEAVERLRELPDAEGVDIVFLGKVGVALAGADEALSREASGFFDRPIDIPALIRKVEALTGGALHDALPARTSTPLPSLPEGRVPPPSSRRPGEPPSSRQLDRPSIVSRGLVTPRPPVAPDTAMPGSDLVSRRTFSIQTPLSSELEALLAEAERRVSARLVEETALPTPEEEIEAVLPAEILSSLDEPIEDVEDDSAARGSDGPERAELGARATTNAGEAGQAETHGGGQVATTTGNRATSSATGTPPRAEKHATTNAGTPNSPSDGSATPSRHEAERYVASSAGVRGASSTLGSVLHADAAALHAAVAARRAAEGHRNVSLTSQKAQSVPPPYPGPAMVPTVLGEWDAPLVLARAIASRTTGTLCIDSTEGVRRAVLREGDLVTAASGVDSESLLAFLGARGDLPREQIQQLAGKLPAFGRHAGAALVAHGHLRQDQLWPVLRAHAEWILGKSILLRSGTAHLEAEPPGRLRNEPSVFGGSTGAEVLVEVVRRAIAPEDAAVRLGGLSGRIGEGVNAALLSECALEGAERDLLVSMRGATLDEVTEAAPGPDLLSLLYALSLLGVVDIVRGVESASAVETPDQAEVDALDEDAIRARIRARLQVVDEGDYFAVLGVAHDATGYEVKRAFLELRRAFDASRILTPRIADLAAEVRQIVDVLEEAYEILSDVARRERYRRAIFAAPEH